MAPTIESQYKDLLNPVKDLEKSFSINISELLYCFVNELMEGKSTANFNSAALILQGSASVYGKKVEYLHNLATQLHNNLSQKKNDPQQQQPKKKDAPKEREKKEDKLNDPFLSTDIKLGKNLSCLKKKNNPKGSSKKPTKKIKSSNAPIHLFINDNDDKGEVFYDTRGEVVGNRGDFAINKCCLINSGWLLLPSVNPNLVPESDPDYYDDSDNSPAATEYLETGDDTEPVQGNSDDGSESCPPSSDIQQSTPSTEVNSEAISTDPSSAAPLSVDEDMEDAPNLDDSPGAENVPADDDEEEPQATAPQPVRQSVRQALKTCQLAAGDDPLIGISVSNELVKKKAIEKKNVRSLPTKLKDGSPAAPPETVTQYCARTFFSLDDKIYKNKLLTFDAECLYQNACLLKRLRARRDLCMKNHKNNEIPVEEETEIDIEGLEVSRDANEDDESLCVPFDDNDVHFEHDLIPYVDQPSSHTSGDNANQVPPPDVPSPDLSHIAAAESENYLKEVHRFIQNSDITERVHEWERSVKPFLDQLEQRGSFDINLYGSQILNSFEDNNRKQTKTFRELCKNMEKWQIHRYFMAVLPLANIGNVELNKEKKPDDTEEIFVTLLSRKMHHKELEEFGHTEGEHS